MNSNCNILKKKELQGRAIFFCLEEMKVLVSEETLVQRRWESKTRKFSIKPHESHDNGQNSTIRKFRSFRCKRWLFVIRQSVLFLRRREREFLHSTNTLTFNSLKSHWLWESSHIILPYEEPTLKTSVLLYGGINFDLTKLLLVKASLRVPSMLSKFTTASNFWK